MLQSVLLVAYLAWRPAPAAGTFAGARTFAATHGAQVVPRMGLQDIYPDEQLGPIRVTEVQLQAMKEGNGRMFWRFVSPEGKRATGVLRKSRMAYLVPPKYAELPVYAPLMNCVRFEVVGALPVGTDRYQCRARVWPAGGIRECGGEAMPAAPIEYIWHLVKQPLVRPSCYEYDPLQMGISAGPPFAGCWLVDDVRVDERRGGSGGRDEAPSGPSDGGAQRRFVVPKRIRSRQLVMKSSDRPTLLGMPDGVSSVDALSSEVLRGLDADKLQGALEHLEVAIFESPPFEKENEAARRRNLALAYWLKDDPAYYPRLIPNAKEVLRQLNGNDAEMQYILGVATLEVMEGVHSEGLAIKALERAVELAPDFAEAREALEKATEKAKGNGGSAS